MIQTVESVFVMAAVTAAELAVMGLMQFIFHPVSAPVLWLVLIEFGAAAAFLLGIFIADMEAMKPFEKLVLMFFPLVIVSVNASQLFPLASAWWICFLLDLLGAVLGAGFAACIRISGQQSRMEERYALSVIEK